MRMAESHKQKKKEKKNKSWWSRQRIYNSKAPSIAAFLTLTSLWRQWWRRRRSALVDFQSDHDCTGAIFLAHAAHLSTILLCFVCHGMDGKWIFSFSFHPFWLSRYPVRIVLFISNWKVLGRWNCMRTDTARFSLPHVTWLTDAQRRDHIG